MRSRKGNKAGSSVVTVGAGIEPQASKLTGRPSTPALSRASAQRVSVFSAPAFEQALQQNRIFQLQDNDLARAIPQLYTFVLKIGFFENRFDGMIRIRDAQTSIEVQLAPNRKVSARDRKKPASSECVLCHPHDHRSRRAQWRNYFLLPNKYPYVTAESEHLLILPTEHKTQSFSTQLLEDMIDFQEFAGIERPLTLHYNGLAGNSQAHLHWQSTHERLPLQRELESGSIRPTSIRTDETNSLESFDQGIYAGFIICGDKKYVARWAAVIVDHLDRDPKTSEVDLEGVRKGTYNLLLLPQTDGRVKLIIQPRRSSHLRVQVGAVGKVGVGAVTLGGIFVIPRSELPDDFFSKVIECVRPTIVPPSEFSWLARVLK